MSNIDEKGIDFLNKLYPKLHMSSNVMNASRNDLSLNPNQKINKYVGKLDVTHTKYRDKERAVQRLKQLYYNTYIIKSENVPESYFDLQKKIALEQGHGYIEFDTDMRKEKIQTIINNQKASLDNWIDYFINKDSDVYPMWAKYWAFQGMITLGSFDKTKSKFNKRTNKTVNGFIDLNREALAMAMDYVIKYNQGNNNIEDKDLEKLVENGSFSKIYSYLLIKLSNQKKIQSDTNLGEWIKYKQGTDHLPLVNSLIGHNTGWCSAGENTARNQLSDGDFYVYYSYDENNNPIIPRIAIRMERSKIAEIRGVAENQNIEPEMEEIVDKKLEEFPDKDKYKKKVSDMKTLTLIYNKYKSNEELNIEELRFLYEIDYDINGFGYSKDPRIKEIIETRFARKDLCIIFNCNENQISFTREEALKGNIIYHKGDLNLDTIVNGEGLVLPQIVGGNVDLCRITNGNGITFPKVVKGDIYLTKLINGEGLILSETVGGTIDLRSLENVKGLILPKEIKGSLDLSKIIRGKDLILPERVDGNLYLNSITNGEGIVFPQTIKGSLYLDNIRNGEGFVLPQEVGGVLNLDCLEEGKGMVLPQTIGRRLAIKSLKNGKGITFPKTIGRYLDLSNINNIEGLIIPEEFHVDGMIEIDHKLMSSSEFINYYKNYTIEEKHGKIK